MNVLVLDDADKRADAIRGAFSAKSMAAEVCLSSNDFMTAVDTAQFDAVYVNADTWKKGRCVYDYFGIGRKLQGKPAVVYNADEGFLGLAGRSAHEQDRVLFKPSSAETALDAA